MEGSSPRPSPVNERDAYALWDAAYVLGSLSDADRREYEAHLSNCRSCRQSVDDLSGLPALLGQLTVAEVAALDEGSGATLPPRRAQVSTSPPPTGRPQRRLVRAATWTMAAAVIVFGVLVGVVFHEGSQDSAPRAEASAVPMTPVAPTELTATVTITDHDWGTRIDMNCTYPAEVSGSARRGRPPGTLAIVVVGRDGTHNRLATWIPVEGVSATPAASTSMMIDQIASVEIVSADTGNPLLQRIV